MKSLAELAAIREKALSKVNMRSDNDSKIRVVVGMATCGIAAGARDVLNAFSEEIAKRNLDNVIVTQTGCIGMCRLEPLVEVYTPDGNKYTYVKMNKEAAAKVVNEHLVNNKPCADLLIQEGM